VLVVLASGHDPIAKELVRRWHAHHARLLTPEDLATPGWSYDPLASRTCTAVIAQDVVPSDLVRGVLVRLPRVSEWHLPTIEPTDRTYVAAEMTAFLQSWLDSLSCPVLNRPSPTCLSGPGWWPEQWFVVAAGLGMPVRSLRRVIAGGSVSSTSELPAVVTATVVGDRCLGGVPDRLARQARSLADSAGVDLLSVRFCGQASRAAVVAIDPWPDVAQSDVSEAILAYLTRKPSR
jgi:hypothetical protein